MGLFSPAWRDKDREKALSAVAALKSDGQLFRAARDASDEAVAIAAAARLNDELLLEELALRESRACVGAAGMALMKLAAFSDEFQTILRMIRDKYVADDSRAAAVIRAAMDHTDNPAVFAKLLSCLSPDGRNVYLQRCERDDAFLTLVLRQAMGIFAHAPEEIQKMLWRFSDGMLLETLGLLDGMDTIFGEVVPTVIGAIKEQASLITAATKLPSASIRLAALQKVSDQNALLHIALNDNSASVRQAAAARIADRAALMRYAAENPEDVTPQLLEKLLRHSGETKSTSGKKRGKRPDKDVTPQTAFDRELLLAIATRSSSVQARQKAFSLLSEPDDINRYARIFPRELDEKILKRVTDQALLRSVACNSGGYGYLRNVRLAAVNGLTDDDSLLEVVMAYALKIPTQDSREMVDAALRRIHDQNRIYRAMEMAHGRNLNLGVNEIEYITDEQVLLNIALKDWSYSSKEAARKIMNVEKLRRIEAESASKDARVAAMEKLEDLRIDALAEADGAAIRTAISGDASPRVRKAAVALTDDQALLKDRIINDKDDDVRTAAIKRLTDRKTLLELIYMPECNKYLFDIATRIRDVTTEEERGEIIAAAAESYKDDSLRQGAVAILAKLKGYSGIDDVHIEYGGVPYIEQKLAELENCTDLNVFRQIHDFLRRAYRASPDCRKALSGVSGKKYNRHYDLDMACASESCNVMVEVTLDL